jgi:hypothetical protein
VKAWSVVMLGAVVAAGAVGGCAERRLAISSEPAGATVWVNDVEVGRTPVEVNFTHYGVYDVRLRLEGYEPIVTSAEAEAPWYEFVGADLITEAVPGFDRTGVVTRVAWNFQMKPSAERAAAEAGDRRGFERELIERANAMRERVEGPK